MTALTSDIHDLIRLATERPPFRESKTGVEMKIAYRGFEIERVDAPAGCEEIFRVMRNGEAFGSTKSEGSARRAIDAFIRGRVLRRTPQPQPVEKRVTLSHRNIDVAWKEARADHAVLLRLEGMTYREIARRLPLGPPQRPRQEPDEGESRAGILFNAGVKALKRAMHKTQFRFVSSSQQEPAREEALRG